MYRREKEEFLAHILGEHVLYLRKQPDGGPLLRVWSDLIRKRLGAISDHIPDGISGSSCVGGPLVGQSIKTVGKDELHSAVVIGAQ